MKKPLIVCGFGRSGTRMVADILNSDRRVSLQSEIPHVIAKPLIDYLVKMQKTYIQLQPELFLEKEHEPFELAFKSACKGRVHHRPGATFFGHKTPRHEAYFASYEAMFSHINKPRYVYCSRDPIKVWASLQNMPWNNHTTVESFIDARQKSLKQLAQMERIASERVFHFRLDDFSTDSHNTISRLFTFLGLEKSDDEIRQTVTLPNTNSSERKVGKPPLGVSQADLNAIQNAFRAEYFNGYGPST